MIQVAKKLSILLLSTVWITQASWAQTTLSFDSETSGTVEPFDPLFDLPPLPKPRPFGLVPAFNSDGETVNPYGTGLFPGASGSLFAGIVEGVTLYEEESAALPTSLATLQANDINLDAALGGDDVIVIGGDSPETSDTEDGMSEAEREKLKRQKVLINKALIKRDPPLLMEIAVLRALDKVTTRITEMEVAKNATIKFGSLAITNRACFENPPTETPESAAFLQIVDQRSQNEPLKVYSGWMFASSPALAAMEHPVYDVWVVDCKNSDNSEAVISSAN
ncbi:DUF2155 domain-containing protein [Alphaproteobacteria bacterium]|jgi:hypothetical protein|nr:DUF2155 domain-containing protein [Alphaproteobacteria bacterium]